MNHKIQSPITDENFSLAWDYANNKLVELQKKKVIRKFLVFVSNITFLLCISVITYGGLLQIQNELVLKYLDSLQFFKIIWNIVGPIIHQPSQHITLQIAICLGFVYLTTFIISGIATLIIWFIYNPNTKRVETMDKSKDSKEFFDLIKELEIRNKKQEGINSLAFSTIYMCGIVILMTFFLNFSIKELNNIGMNDKIKLTIDTISFVSFLLFLIYCVLNSIMSKILKILYTTKIDKSLKYDAENYYYECNKAAKEEFDEEERILKKAEEIKAKRKKEEEYLLTKVNYKNPIYKYIKFGIVTIIMIITIIFVSNNLKNMDFEEFITDSTESVESSTEMADSSEADTTE